MEVTSRNKNQSECANCFDSFRTAFMLQARRTLTYLIQAQPRRAILSVGCTTHSAITSKSCFNISVVAGKWASFLTTSGPRG